MPRYYEFEVALQELQPRIWRRFLLRTTSTFAHLHRAIQDGFGWEDYHLWEFRLAGWQGRPIAGLPGGEEYGRSTPDARSVKLNSYFTGRVKLEWCEYLYDFGDRWVHEVKLVDVHSEKGSFKRRLLAGERSGPREDCGGPPGYERTVHYRQTGEDLFEDEGVDLGEWQPEMDLSSVKAEFDR